MSVTGARAGAACVGVAGEASRGGTRGCGGRRGWMQAARADARTGVGSAACGCWLTCQRIEKGATVVRVPSEENLRELRVGSSLQLRAGASGCW